MTNKEYVNHLTKVMKPYWESIFSHTKLEEYLESSGIWFGFGVNGKTIIGCPANVLEDGIWYYNGGDFIGGADLFCLDKNGFRLAMQKYLNETYNLNIKQIY